MQLNLDAPILPGVGVAGIRLGMPLDAVVRANLRLFRAEPIYDTRGLESGKRYRSASVDLWSAEAGGGITHIMAHGLYRGLLHGQIGLGSSITGIEGLIGPCSEDDEDNLVIDGIRGLCFEIGATFANPGWRHAPVIWFCVYRPRRDYHQGPREAQRTLRMLIRDFVSGVDRSHEQVRRIEALLREWFPGTRIQEELDFPLRRYGLMEGARRSIDDERLADALLYAWTQYLPEGEDVADTGGLPGAPLGHDPASRLRRHIVGFLNGVNRSRRYVEEIEGLLLAGFRGAALYEELSPYLATFSPGGGPGLRDEEELAAEFRYVLTHYLSEPYPSS